MDRSADNLGQTISNIQRDLEELKSNQGTGGGGGGGGGEEYFAGNGIDIDQSNTISVDTSVVATQTDLASKQGLLTAGSHISISNNNTISATGIPTKTSDLTNDGEDGSGSYVDSSELDKYYRSLVPFGTAITTQGTDLNTITYLSVGKYYCSANNTAATLLNCPTDKAFMMEVFNPLTTDVDDETTRNWVYRTRLITTYEGRMYMQAANSSATAGVFTYGDWEEITQSGDLATVATTGDYDDLTNKPTIPAAQVNSDWNSTSGVSEILNKPTLATVATSGSYNDLTDKPTIPSGQIQSDWTQSDNTKVDYIKNKPSLATVATTGSYNDLTNKPTIPAAQIQSDWTQSDNTKADFIKNKPTIDSALSDSSTNAVQNKVVTGKINEIDRYYRSLVPVGTAITTQNTDLNTVDYLKVGKYYCALDSTAATLQNCPDTHAFMMEVFSPLSTTIDNESTSTWVYRLRILTTYLGKMYIQFVQSGGTAGNFTYHSWEEFAKGTINNGTLTIQQNGTNVATFSANQSSNATANIETKELVTNMDARASLIPSTVAQKNKSMTVFTTMNALDSQTQGGGYADALVLSTWNDASGGRINTLVATKNSTNPELYHYTGAYNGSSWSAKKKIAYTTDMPTVNDATLTITQNGTSAGTFSANASSNATIALTDTTYSDMTGASSSAAGTAGLVPAPSAGDQEKYLRGDGTWQPAGGSTDIPDGAVTTAKLADSAVTTAKIDGSAVTTAKIANNAVTASKIDFTSFIAGTADFTAVSAGGANDVSVNIPTQANTDYLIFLQLAGHTGYWTNLVYRPGTKTTTNFTITVYNSGNGSSGSFQIHYLVIPQ